MINDELWDQLTMVGKAALFLPWLVRSLLVLILSPIGFPIYLLFTSKLYYRLEEKAIKFYLDTIEDYQEFLKEVEKQGKKNTK